MTVADTPDQSAPPDPPDAPRLTARRTAIGVVIAVLFVIGTYGVLPQIPELRSTLEQLRDGDGAWLLAALGFEVASFAGYVLVFRSAFGDAPGMDWRFSYRLTMAGVAATRLLAAGGAGGIVLTGWALTRAGMDAADARRRLAAFLALLYAPYMLALLLFGLGLRTGVLPGPAPFGLTVVPAIFGGAVIVTAFVLALVPPDLEEQVVRGPRAGAPRGRTSRILAAIPATVSAGVRGAMTLLATRRPGLAGVIAWWAFDVAVLWACLHAFGVSAPVAVVVLAYFVGMTGNLLPLPGGVGGVEGGMIGALVGFGVAGAPAVLGVLAYRAFAFWLPILPGSLAYFGLVRTVRNNRATP